MLNLTKDQVNANLEALTKVLKTKKLPALYIPSFDHNISEYVPLWNNLRYYLTGFTGSTADTLLLDTGKIHLFVDGRYHIQADQEVESSNVIIEKLEGNIRIFQAVINKAQDSGVEKLGYIPERTPYSFLSHLNENFQPISFSETNVLKEINFQQQTQFPPVVKADEGLIGQNVQARLSRCPLKKGEAYFLSAIDDIAWITNMRGYHLPFLSSFLAKALVTKDKIYLFSQDVIQYQASDQLIEVHQYKDSYKASISNLITNLGIKNLHFDKNFSTLFDYETLKTLPVDLNENEGLNWIKCLKTSVEIPEYERIFEKGSQAIFETIQWCKNSIGDKVSEFDLYNKTSEFYKANGALGQSFNTISGAGENGAIVHYGDPKADRIITKEDLVLLDSGGYFETGLATDTTRTFLADSSATGHDLFDDYKKHYTLVLRSQIQTENAVFPTGTKGNALDMLCRQVLHKEGLDFLHGLGHGVGVHVHEGGVRLSSVSNISMKEGQLVSIEPGLYFEEKYGIRHENIAIVEKHPKLNGYLRFRTLVFIGAEETLVDESMMTPDELKYYKWYQSECLKRKRIF